MGWGGWMLRWTAFLRKCKPARTFFFFFFQNWVVRRSNVVQARTHKGANCRRAATRRGIKGPRGSPVESDPQSPVWLSLSPAVHPGCRDHSPAVTDRLHYRPRGDAHSEDPIFSVGRRSKHLLAWSSKRRSLTRRTFTSSSNRVAFHP